MKTNLKSTLPSTGRAMLVPSAKRVVAFFATAAASLLSLSAIAAPGDLYVTDLATNSILVFAPDGTQRTFATGLDSPQGIAFDQAKNLYVVDGGSGSVFKYDLAGNKTTFITGLSNPIGLAWDGSDLLVSENGVGQVTRLPLDGIPPKQLFTTVAAPLGLASHAFDQTGFTRYIAHDNSVLEVAPDLTTTDVDLGVGTRATAEALVLVGAGTENDVFISTDAGTILKITNGGTATTFGSGLTLPNGMDFRPPRFSGDTVKVGNLYVADTTAHNIVEFTPQGVQTTFVAAVGSPNFVAFEVQSAPVITSVLSATATEGQPFSYQITATNSPTSFNATGLPGGLTVDTATGLITGTPTVIGTFSVNLSATNPGGTGTAVLTLAVGVQSSSPVITSALSATATKGQPFSYQITATNLPTSFNATGLPGGLTVDTATGLITGTPTVIGTFSVNLSAANASGTGTAALTLNVGSVPLTVLLQNISTRAQVLTGDNVLIGGFIIKGGGVPAPKTVAIRALGPSLTGAGVSGALANPVLELHEPDGTVITNNNWESNTLVDRQTIIADGLDQYNGGTISDLESIIIADLPSVDPNVAGSGQYTAVVTGFGGGTGVGLVEVYDLDDPTNTTTELGNISTRGLVGTADNDFMIGGLLVGPSGNSGEVILRALGPSLAGAVADPLADPTMTLFDANATPLQTNNDWKDNSVADQAIITNSGLDQYNGGTINDLESVIVVANLAAGEYTAVVSGVGGVTGVGLVEAYHIAAAPAAK